ncbi:guanylate kinase [Neisseria sp. HSC-16F19]|nr:guanylate kinase [Neisseria sp. HSC-16F19]MCP2040720.1 guanylate kinase [Neisseria sp. HSC-16F19]
MHTTGRIFIVSAASGTGKTTLVSRLVQNHPRIRVCVSHTSRAPRGSEENGVHYHFVTTAEFEQMIGEGAFLEHANVFGHYYGTSTAALEAITSQGMDVILEIDVQGAEQVRRALPEATSIFILPPSFAVLAERLSGRGTDAPEVVFKRLAQARNEIEQSYLFDYVVVNDDLIQAEHDLLHIIRAQHLQQAAQRHTIEAVLANP